MNFSYRSLVVALVFATAALFAVSPSATAQTPLTLAVEGGGSQMLTTSYQSAYGFGAHVIGRVAIALHPNFALQLSGANWWFPSEALDGTGRLYAFEVGVRYQRPLDRSWVGGPIMDANVGLGVTGGLQRFVFDVGLGWSFHPSDLLELGPVIRYHHILQPDDAPQADDAMLLVYGLDVRVNLSLGGGGQGAGDGDATESEDAGPDSDADGVPDALDRCPGPVEDLDGFQDDDGCPDGDNDSDGVPDEVDRCRSRPETYNGFQDEDGCPDEAPPPPLIDTDADGVADHADRCPDADEDVDGYQDEDGCPDEDNDSDGIPDADDQCRDLPESRNGFDDDDGCPDEAPPAEEPATQDRDGDGVPDDQDRCPREREDRDGFEDEDGCADRDNDQDGIPDRRDRCPMAAEVRNGFQDRDGCPDEAPIRPEPAVRERVRTEVVTEVVTEVQTEVRTEVRNHFREPNVRELHEVVIFPPNSFYVRPAYRGVLRAICRQLQNAPGSRLRIVGHTDALGSESTNQRLSALRAGATAGRMSLCEGVEGRIESSGQSAHRPACTEDTMRCRRQNRRVTFELLE